jgi:hypothetical protein
MKSLPLVLAIATGLLGGVVSHYVWPQPVHAQSQATAPKEVRAQSFVLVNDKGEVQGVFSFDESQAGRPTIKLFDGNGREIWSAGGPQVRPLGAH